MSVKLLYSVICNSFCYYIVNICFFYKFIQSSMPRKLTLEERKFILKRYWKTENAQDVIHDWNHYFNTDPPTRLAIYKLRDKFHDTGSVADAPRSGRPSVCTEQNLATVAEAYGRSPKKSLRHASAEIGIKRISLRKILTKLQMRPYIPTLIMTCAPKFVRVWYHVVENVLELKASNLNICHRNCLPWL